MAKRLLTVACLALPPSAAFADAPNPSFYLVNRASQPINQVYVSPVAATGWGRDQLGDNTLNAGAYVPIRLHADGNCMFDLRIVYQDGRKEERAASTPALWTTSRSTTVGRAGTPAVPATPQARDPTFRVVNNAHARHQRAVSSRGRHDKLGDATGSATTRWMPARRR